MKKNKTYPTPDMEYYVLINDWNNYEIVRWNIFNNIKFYDGVMEELTHFITYDTFKDRVNLIARLAFWSKAEYEIVCGGLYTTWKDEMDPDDFVKLDVYYQIELNLDIICHYIIDCWNNRPHARKKIGE